jgi:hypothetical protein
MRRMLLVLKRSPKQELALEKFLDDQGSVAGAVPRSNSARAKG